MDRNTAKFALRDALAPHVHKALMDPCLMQTNDDPKQKDRSDQGEVFLAAAEVLCPPSLGVIPNSCSHETERRVAAQWKDLVQQSRTPSTLSSQKCQPTAVSQVYTQQFNSIKAAKKQSIDTNTKDNVALGVAVAGGLAAGSAAEKLRNKIRAMQENRRRIA